MSRRTSLLLTGSMSFYLKCPYLHFWLPGLGLDDAHSLDCVVQQLQTQVCESRCFGFDGLAALPAQRTSQRGKQREEETRKHVDPGEVVEQPHEDHEADRSVEDKSEVILGVVEEGEVGARCIYEFAL